MIQRATFKIRNSLLLPLAKGTWDGVTPNIFYILNKYWHSQVDSPLVPQSFLKYPTREKRNRALGLYSVINLFRLKPNLRENTDTAKLLAVNLMLSV
jgi:hypothetical protein